ncbi:uncharacterized protein [Diabrotica undecimpunctata]|uniref:uncharacterized protein n=1 Tax=Diabrotica undecimpunctata TaxID=50387 RepID=UPI003B63AEA3
MSIYNSWNNYIVLLRKYLNQFVFIIIGIMNNRTAFILSLCNNQNHQFGNIDNDENQCIPLPSSSDIEETPLSRTYSWIEKHSLVQIGCSQKENVPCQEDLQNIQVVHDLEHDLNAEFQFNQNELTREILSENTQFHVMENWSDVQNNGNITHYSAAQPIQNNDISYKSRSMLEDYFLENTKELTNPVTDTGEKLQTTVNNNFENRVENETELNLSDNSIDDPNFTCHSDLNSSVESDGETTAVRRKKNKDVPTPLAKCRGNEKTSRSRKQRKLAKVLRNTGKLYLTEKGKTIAASTMNPLNDCRLKCKIRFSDDTRRSLFNEYWQLKDRNRRANFISSLICIVDKKTIRVRSNSDRVRKFSCKYEVCVNGKREKICKKCLIATFGETNAFINQIIVNRHSSVSAIIIDDQRGLNSPKNKWSEQVLNEVVAHIRSFPAYESHYCRQTTSKLYLQSDLTIAKMYRLYKENTEIKNCVSMTIYSAKFHELGLKFKKPQKDTCSKCDSLAIKISYAEETEKENLILEQKKHHVAAQEAYNAKSSDKTLAINDPTTAVFAFDLQQCLPTPYLKTYISFYKRQLWTYNLTVHNLVTGIATCYIWNESVSARGGNQIASCLYRHLMDLP